MWNETRNRIYRELQRAHRVDVTREADVIEDRWIHVAFEQVVIAENLNTDYLMSIQ
jgi:hypothetical protein